MKLEKTKIKIKMKLEKTKIKIKMKLEKTKIKMDIYIFLISYYNQYRIGLSTNDHDN